jgi:hypothetical protein
MVKMWLSKEHCEGEGSGRRVKKLSVLTRQRRYCGNCYTHISLTVTASAALWNSHVIYRGYLAGSRAFWSLPQQYNARSKRNPAFDRSLSRYLVYFTLKLF